MENSTASPAAGENSKDASADECKPLPPLSPADFRIYNSLAERMDAFHNHFRYSWTTLYDACLAGRRPKHLTLKQFMRVGLGFCDNLEAHHNIEEQYFFPLLAERMPEFRRNQELVRQHKVIHAGLDKLREYLSQCEDREREFRLEELKEIMDTFKDVLWAHLDQEVKDLGAENMRRFWSIEDMKAMPG